MEPAADRPPLYLALPDWEQGPVSGGHIYNRHFAHALPTSQPWQRLAIGTDLESWRHCIPTLDRRSWLIVDTLWHDYYIALGSKPRPRTALLVHLLAEMTGDLGFSDAKPWPWLDSYDHFLATGCYTKNYLLACGVEPRRITLIEPRLWPRDLGSAAFGTAGAAGAASSPVSSGNDKYKDKDKNKFASSLALTGPKGKPHWLTIANLIPGKGILAALESLQHLLGQDGGSNLADFCWTIYGSHDVDPWYAERCRALVAADPSLGPRVEFVNEPAQGEPARLLHRCDLFISSSKMETYGMAVAEALALGKPVAAIATGNIPYLLGRDNAKHRLVQNTCQLMQAALSCGSAGTRIDQPPPAIGHCQASFAEAVAAFSKKVLI